MNQENTSRVALVTGGSRGIGRAIVEELSTSGWRVAFTYRGSREMAEGLSRELQEQGRIGNAVCADVRDYEQRIS